MKGYQTESLSKRSDNAAAYKSQATIQAMYQLSKELDDCTIAGYYFSEPQSGKSRCDAVSVVFLEKRVRICYYNTFLSVFRNFEGKSLQ